MSVHESLDYIKENYSQPTHNLSGWESWECFDLIEFSIFDFFQLYYIPIISVFGLIGNFLSCIVFLSSPLKMRSSSYYIAALAVADLVYLVTLLMVWSNSVGFHFFDRHGWCQGIVYAGFVCSFLSVWLVVVFTVERFIAVQYPLHRRLICTVSRAKCIVTTLTCVALVLYSYSFVMVGPITDTDREKCGVQQRYHETFWIINLVDSIFTLIVPLLLVIVLNILITRKLIKSSKYFSQDRRTDINLSISSRQSGPRCQHSVVSQETEIDKSQCGSMSSPPSRAISMNSSGRNIDPTMTQQSITKMLLLVSTFFILFNLPSYVVRVYPLFVYSLSSHKTPPTIWCIQQFAMVLYYTNFSINFVLYSMCGSSFRRCLRQVIRSQIMKIISTFQHLKRRC